MLASDLGELIKTYGPAMAHAASEYLKPWHDAGDPTPDLSDLEACRTRNQAKAFALFPSQKEKVVGIVEGIKRHGRAWMVGECGCGKTPMSLAAAWRVLKNKPCFRILVMCPSHLVRKWKREVAWLIPNVRVAILKKLPDLHKFQAEVAAHPGPAVAIISKESAKLGVRVDVPCAASRLAYVTKQVGYQWIKETVRIAACPSCGAILRESDRDDAPPMLLDKYRKRDTPARCQKCGEKLATQMRGHLAYPHLDRYIQRKCRRFFDLFIADEVHELAGSDTMQGNSFGTLASACRYTIALTGTLIGGRASDLHAPLWRMSADLLRNRGFDLKPLSGGKVSAIGRNSRNFTSAYGVMEYTVVRECGDDYGRVRYGKCGRRKEYKTPEVPRPGISPDLYNHFLIGRGVFMSLAELGPALPTINRFLVPCTPSQQLRSAYRNIDEALLDAIKKCRSSKERKGPHPLAGIRIMALDAYLDAPWNWRTITMPVYDKESGEVHDEPIVTPLDLGQNHEDDKDAKLIKTVKAELAEGRRCAIYVSFTGEHDVRPKIQAMLTRAGVRATILPDSVPPVRREDWIEAHLPDMDVLIVHPKRVMTGLDLIGFPSLIWYQLGYSTHVLRQASARARRPIQTKPCRVYFFYYTGTIQEKALGLMGEKEAASQALEGTFDPLALRALMNGGEDPDILTALARSIEGKMNMAVVWAKVDRAENAGITGAPAAVEPQQDAGIVPTAPPPHGGAFADCAQLGLFDLTAAPPEDDATCEQCVLPFGNTKPATAREAVAVA